MLDFLEIQSKGESHWNQSIRDHNNTVEIRPISHDSCLLKNLTMSNTKLSKEVKLVSSS